MGQSKNQIVKPIYIIKLQGNLSDSWSEWFDGFTFTHEEHGTTNLTGEVADQAALHGLLKKIRDLGLPLISVNRIESQESSIE